jgi:hypothetical protein
MPAIVIINVHEPEGETAARLMELAAACGHDTRTVVAMRGEHNAALSFQVPQDVADLFNEDRGDRWPSPDELVDDDADPSTPPVRKLRPGKAKEE